MQISLNWLRDFVPYEGEAQELGDRLTMLGLELEDIFDPFEKIKNIVVGHVVECERHPEADKLSVCTVDVGDEEPVTIVCGAPNVAKGQNVPVAKVGSVMPDGMKIKKAKLRGVKSFGMICSERELEISEGHQGIMVLSEEFKPGQLLVDALKLERTVLDVDITPNKADCLSILGVARETALAFGLPLTMPKMALQENGSEIAGTFHVKIDDPSLCPMYSARIIRGIQMGQSPDWMRYRLLSIGLRPISNIVDVTNYVMMELGQPLHAFDLNLIEGNMIRVAAAKEGSMFTTLDGQERKMLAADVQIWDGKKPVALAGVMGGANSEMNDSSVDVLLESAVFRPASIRKTARRLALPSDASYRFERGVDQQMSHIAMERAAQLINEVAGGSVMKGKVVAEPTTWQPRFHGFRLDRCNSLLGLELDNEFCKETLTRLGCKVDDSNADNWKVESPSHRLDLEREVDLYEEMARVYGMDRIPVRLPKISKSLEAPVLSDTVYGFIRRVKNWAAGCGLHEAINYSFTGNNDLDLLNLPKEGRVQIANPLSEDQGVMRTDLAAGLLTALKNNRSQGMTHVRLFEVAKVFFEDSESDTNTREHNRLSILMYGRRHEQLWPQAQEDAGYQDVKGAVEHFFDSLKLGAAEFALAEGHPFMEPCVDVLLGGQKLGVIGMVKAETADAYHAVKEVWMADIDLDAVRELFIASKIQFETLPVFPPSRRDMTAIAPLSVKVADVHEAIGGIKAPLLESVELVDVYVPGDDAEERNLTFRLTYRHATKTLKDKEVDKAHKKILDGVQEALPVKF
ncbi:MAG: phenylalanine--tRNA ligase subunit beta [Desulfovibrio sp.]